VQRPIAFGRKVFLAESARDLIAQHDVWDGNPVDEQHVVVSLKRHKPTIGDVPQKVRRLSFQPQPDRVQFVVVFRRNSQCPLTSEEPIAIAARRQAM
jgi:hypothetical protein